MKQVATHDEHAWPKEDGGSCLLNCVNSLHLPVMMKYGLKDGFLTNSHDFTLPHRTMASACLQATLESHHPVAYNLAAG